MRFSRARVAVSAAGITVLLLSGCGGGSSASNDNGGEKASGEATSSASSDGGQCSVHLFDADDFDASDDNFELTEAGKYKDLSDLPGAGDDWTDEADSIKVGSGTNVTIWSEPNFKGKSQKLKPGSKHSGLDEPSSMKVTC